MEGFFPRKTVASLLKVHAQLVADLKEVADRETANAATVQEEVARLSEKRDGHLGEAATAKRLAAKWQEMTA